jgi:hypothetical protein|uniref:hypothetical protein n=1 Tax=Cephaloticoccus sp. TaxID=1985742 RepID=UPI004048F37B
MHLPLRLSWLWVSLPVIMTALPPSVRDLGIPVKGVSWTRLHPGQTADGQASLLATMSQNNDGFFVSDIDLETGHCTQFYTEAPKRSTFSPASYRSLLTGILYVCSAWDGHLHRFDANHPEKRIEDLGRVDEIATFGNGITETPDGMIWIGAYPGATLTRFNPTTGEFTRFGGIVDDDKYLYPVAGGDGSLAVFIKSNRPRVRLIDPLTGESQPIGPIITDPTDETQFLKLYRGTDESLYLESHAGTWRISGMAAEPVDQAPPPRPGIAATYQHNYQDPLDMPGGWTAEFTDADMNGTGAPRDLVLTNRDPAIAPRHLRLDWVGGGNNLHVIGVGPDGDLYGSSYLPNRLFHAKPDGSVIEDLGKHSFAGGQAYSLVNLDGKLYLASYPGSHLTVYDPTLPLHYGTEPTDNPRDLGRLDNVSFRPNALIATPDKRLWMGSAPDYGLHGGTLVWYDPASGESKTHRSLLPDTTPSALLYLPNLKQILVGLSIEVGTGATVRRNEGAFALWDPTADKLIWSGDLGIEDMADPVAFTPTVDGLVYVLIGRGDQILSAGAPAIRPRIALIDPAQRKLISIAWLPEDFGPIAWHGHFSLRVGPGGTVYGATGYCVFRIKPGTCEVERVWQNDQPPPPREDPVWLTHSTPDAIDVVGPIIGNQFYFSTGWRLRVLTLD